MNDRAASSERSSHGPAIVILCAALGMLAGHTGESRARPQRVVSINVCTDQLVAMLLPRERIASLSYLAADARTSAIAAEIEGMLLNRGTAEEIIALEPDLIVAGASSLRPTVTLLRRLGFNVLELPMAETVNDIVLNLLRLGDALEEPERARAAVDALEARLTRLSVEDDVARPLFVNYDVNGWTTGQTGLLADIAHRAGLATPGDRFGFAASARLSLESLLQAQPDLVDLGYPWDDPPALASMLWQHPIMRAVIARATIVDIPDSAWLCGTPRTLDALATLRSARDALLAAPRAASP